jgi:hypothetical protein
MDRVDSIRRKFLALGGVMDERVIRLWAATEAEAFGHGGISAVAEATGFDRGRIRSGLREIEEIRLNPPTDAPRSQRIRRPGAGRKSRVSTDPTLVSDLDSIVEPTTRGDPESPLRWTCKSTRRLADELRGKGHDVGASTVRTLLTEAGYSLQSVRKTLEGKQHPDRNAQFEYLNRQARAFARKGQPVISVDTKKKELIGDFKNAGREWQPNGDPIPVRVHDFIDKELGKAIPYGVYDVARNEAWVNVGVDHDTAEFAVESILRWWRKMGRRCYPNATDLLVTADAGGSNAPRTRLWKSELQRLASVTGLRITVCHYPPGTSKWNKIEHRLFCHITQNWRGRPLESLETIVSLIGNTTTRAGLRVRAAVDPNSYEVAIKVPDDEFQALNIKPHKFHGEWNYVVEGR